MIQRIQASQNQRLNAALPLDRLVDTPKPDFRHIFAELNAAITKAAGEKPKQTEISTIVMDDGSVFVSVVLTFPSGRLYSGAGTTVKTDYVTALDKAYADIQTQLGQQRTMPQAVTQALHNTELLEEPGYGHGV